MDSNQNNIFRKLKNTLNVFSTDIELEYVVISFALMSRMFLQSRKRSYRTCGDKMGTPGVR